MYRLSVDKEIETAQSDFSCLSDVDSVGSNLQALKNELDKTKEELDKIDNFDISAKNNTTRANATAYPRENSPAHDDCTDDMEVIKASDGRVEGNSDDWSSCSAILGDGTEERNTGKFWQCAKNTVSTTIKLVEEVKAMRSERESLRHELALSKAEVDLLQQKVKKGVSSKYGSINGSCNLLEIENEMLMHSADVDGQRHSTALEPDVRDDGHTNFEEEETTQRRRAIEMKMNSFISKLNGVERHTTQLAAFDDDDLSDGKCMFHDPKGLMEASMPHTRSDTQEIAREGGQHMKAHEFIDLSQQVKELQGTVKRQLKELEELQSLRERDAKESMMLQSMLQGKLLKLQETVQEQASQLHVIRDLRELVKELKAMTMTTGTNRNVLGLTAVKEAQILIDFTGEKRHQNPFVTGSSRSPPNLTPRHWCENSEALDLECSAINGEHDVTKYVLMLYFCKPWSVLVLCLRFFKRALKYFRVYNVMH